MAVKIFRPHISMGPNKSQENNKSKTPIDSNRYIPKKHQQFAADMEQQFAKYMIEQMNKSTKASQSSDPGAGFYRDLLQDEQAKTLTNSGHGIGIKDMILDDIYPKKYRNEAAFKAYEESQNRFNKNPYQNVTAMGPVQPETVKKYKEQEVSLGVPNNTGAQNE